MEMLCIVCSKPLSNPKAKVCSGACKMRARRGKGVTIIKAPEDLVTVSWHDSYGKCDGCDGTACPEGFVANWTRLKDWEVIQKRLKKIVGV